MVHISLFYTLECPTNSECPGKLLTLFLRVLTFDIFVVGRPKAQNFVPAINISYTHYGTLECVYLVPLKFIEYKLQNYF